jgi:hypothetical protein
MNGNGEAKDLVFFAHKSGPVVSRLLSDLRKMVNALRKALWAAVSKWCACSSLFPPRGGSRVTVALVCLLVTCHSSLLFCHAFSNRSPEFDR